MRIRLSGMLVAIATLLVCPALGTAGVVRATRLTVAPAHPHVRTAVVIGFVQPTIAAEPAAGEGTEVLGVTGPARPGCASSEARTVVGAAAGTRLRETLRPGPGRGGRWCPGEYRVSLVLTRSSGCPIGTPKRICPQFAIAPTVVATTRFRITAG